MLKLIGRLIPTLICVCLIAIPYHPVALAVQPISITVDGRPLLVDAAPAVRDGRVLVPLRAIFEALGATVRWDAGTQTITGSRGDRTVILTIGNRQAAINGSNLTLDVPPAVIGGRTMVPVRFIADGLGARAAWDAHLRTLSIRTDGAVPTTPATLVIAARQAVVTGITDGDTIRVNIGGQTETVRLIGIDTPETRHPERGIEPFGPEAAAFTKEHLDGRTVWLEMDAQERDRFGRLLAYIWTSQPTAITADSIASLMFNARLLSVGLAQIATFPPNVRYVEHFTALQREAQAAGRGLWRATAETPAQPGALRIVRLTEAVERGGTASITVQGRPHTEYSITVTYKSGPSRARGLEPKISGADGRVQWSWTVGRLTTPGSWPIDVRGGGESVRIHFTVR